jgi:hypothetical protein
LVGALAALAFALTFGFADIDLSGDVRGLDAHRLDDLVKLELGTTSTSTSSSTSTIDKVSVRIDGDRAEVTVVRGGATRSGSVALPHGNVERTIALFVGELARRFETEPAPEPPAKENPPPPPPPKAEPARPPVLPVPGEPSEHARVGPYGLVSMGARWFARDGSLLATPRLEGGLETSAFRLGLSARYAYGRASDPLGTASLHALTFGLSPSLVLGEVVTTGPRLELGFLSASGEGTRASSTSAFALSAGWEVELDLRIGDSFAVAPAIEAGWMIEGIDVRADDRSVLEIAGPFAGASIGLALLPALARRSHAQ